MRLPNGYGNVSKLPGKRRNPWRARKTVGWELEEDKAKQKYVTIGYYKSRTDALKALSEYEGVTSSMTLLDIYNKWSYDKYQSVGDSSIKGYKSAWLLCEPIKNKKIIDINLDTLQKIADKSNKNYPMLRKFKVLMKELFKYAVIHGIIKKDQNIVEYLNIKKAGNPNAHNRKPFSEGEIKRLWDNKDNENVATILMLIYSGLRIGELLDLDQDNIEDDYIKITKSKTKAGIRTIPIHNKVLPFFKTWDNKMTYNHFYNHHWKPTLESLGMDHTPHDTRHTFISLLTAAKVDERFIQQLAGHKGSNVTRSVYTHLELEEVRKELNKI